MAQHFEINKGIYIVYSLSFPPCVGCIERNIFIKIKRENKIKETKEKKEDDGRYNNHDLRRL